MNFSRKASLPLIVIALVVVAGGAWWFTSHRSEHMKGDTCPADRQAGHHCCPKGLIARHTHCIYADDPAAESLHQYRCLLNGRTIWHVNVNAGTDATWACNNWKSECGNAPGGCTAQSYK